jgi:CubicO group peptidase (beta-lactamase class C family)
LRLGVSLVLVVAAACSSPPPATLPPWPPPQLSIGGDPSQTIAALAIQMPPMLDHASVPGLSMAIVSNGELRWSAGFGVADARSHLPVDKATIVEAGSLGKPVLAVVALALVEAGKLDLDAPIAKWYADPELVKDPSYRRVTLRQLLSHTSGLTNLRANQPQTIHFPPGDHFSYSGVGFLVAQRLIEKVTGESLDAVAARLVFGPAGMTNSSFIWQRRFDDHTATGHDALGQPMQKRRPSVAFAPASLQTTAEDYGRFVAALLAGRLIGARMLDEMWKAQVAVSPSCVECPGPVPAERSSNVFWGLGWGIDKTSQGTSVWHWGDNDVFRSYLVAWPARKTALVFFTNSVNGLGLRNDLVNHVAGGEHPDWDFVKYDQYDSPVMVAMKSIQTAFARSPGDGVAEYKRQKALGVMPADESSLDLLGFRFFSQRQPQTAIAVWELEAQEFPGSWHAYDNLGLGYKVTGDTERSIANYRKALAINPADDNAKRALAGR